MRSGKDAQEVKALQDVSGSPRNHRGAVKRTPVCAGTFTSDPALRLQPLLPPHTDRTFGGGAGKGEQTLQPHGHGKSLVILCLSFPAWKIMTHIPILLSDPQPFVSSRGD